MIQPRTWFTCIATRARWQFVLACCSPGPPGPFLAKLHPSRSDPYPYHCLRLLSPRWRTDLVQLLLVSSSKLLRSVWLTSHSSFQFAVICKLGEGIESCHINLFHKDSIRACNKPWGKHFFLATRLPLHHQWPPSELSCLASFPPVLWSYLPSLYLTSLSRTIVWETVANALLKSRQMTSTACSVSAGQTVSSQKMIRLVKTDYP